MSNEPVCNICRREGKKRGKQRNVLLIPATDSLNQLIATQSNLFSFFFSFLKHLVDLLLHKKKQQVSIRVVKLLICFSFFLVCRLGGVAEEKQPKDQVGKDAVILYFF